MIIYSREQHEYLAVAWHYELRRDPKELADLFMQPLQNLTAFLHWTEHTVKFVFAKDAQGIWAAAWVEPIMSGAFFGAWIRKDKRKGVGQYAFINRCFNISLETFPILIALTRRKELDTILLALGFEKAGEYPHLFAGNTALAYTLTKESRSNRYESRFAGRRQKYIDRHNEHEQPVGADVGEVREVGAADLPAVEHADRRGTENGRGGSADTDHQPKPRRRKRRGNDFVEEYARSTGAIGAGEHLVRTGDNGAGPDAG